MLLRVTKICSGRLEAVQNSQICDLAAVTFIMPMPVKKGQAGGGVEFLTKMTLLPLGKMPATQVVPPQDAKARHANTTTALRSVFQRLRGRHRMGYSKLHYEPCADRNSAWDSMPVRGLAQEGRFSSLPARPIRLRYCEQHVRHDLSGLDAVRRNS